MDDERFGLYVGWTVVVSTMTMTLILIGGAVATAFGIGTAVCALSFAAVSEYRRFRERKMRPVQRHLLFDAEIWVLQLPPKKVGVGIRVAELLLPHRVFVEDFL